MKTLIPYVLFYYFKLNSVKASAIAALPVVHLVYSGVLTAKRKFTTLRHLFPRL